MRRTSPLITAVVLVVVACGAPALALAAPGPPAPLVAGPTYYGTFSEGIGYNTGRGIDDYKKGTYEFEPLGFWNVAFARTGPVITGVLRGLACPYQPCFGGWALNLSGGTPWAWVEEDPNVFESFVDWGAVTFDLTFTIDASGEGTLALDIEGCPHGWDWMEVW